MRDNEDENYALPTRIERVAGHKLPSKHQIGDLVHFCPIPDSGTAPRIKAYIRAILFSNIKVRYSLYLKESKSTIHNIDSILVVEPRSGVGLDRMDFGEDNYS